MLVTHSYWPESTPPQRRWMAFVRVFRTAGWDVDVVAPHPVGEDSNPQIVRALQTANPWQETGPSGESVHRLPRLIGRKTRARRLAGQCVVAALSVPRAMVVRRPDVVVVTIPGLPQIVAGWLIATLRRRPLVVDMRDAWPDLAYDSNVANPRVTRILDKVMTGVQRRADLVVTVTKGFQRRLVGRGIVRTVTVHNGITRDRLPIVPPRSDHGGPLRVLYMGNHGESQGLDVVVQAAAMAGPDVEVRFVGNGALRSYLMALSDKLDAGVDFRSVVHDESLSQHYEWADTCVVSLRSDWPSFNWTVPSKIYELLATGRHVTAIVRGEAARIIEASDGGDVVEARPRDLVRFWRELSQRPELLGRNTGGREWVMDHAYAPSLAKEYMEHLTSLLKSKSPAR